MQWLFTTTQAKLDNRSSEAMFVSNENVTCRYISGGSKENTRSLIELLLLVKRSQKMKLGIFPHKHVSSENKASCLYQNWWTWFSMGWPIALLLDQNYTNAKHLPEDQKKKVSQIAWINLVIILTSLSKRRRPWIPVKTIAWKYQEKRLTEACTPSSSISIDIRQNKFHLIEGCILLFTS